MNTERRALLLVAHGSRLEDANQEIAKMADLLRDDVSDKFGILRHAFLEIASPNIPEGIEACVEEGAQLIQVLPYFLAAGRHVRDDIPSIVEDARDRFPGVELHLQNYLGMSEAMPKFLARFAEE